MATPVIIMGRSGTGKSYSLRNFAKGEIGLVNVLGKPLPFRNDLQSVATTDYGYIAKAIAESKARSIVVDDAGFLITDMFMTRHASAGTGNGVFALYNDLGDEFYKMMRGIAALPDSADKIVYILMHEDMDEMGRAKIKTIGKLLDEKVSVESMVTILLQSVYVDGRYLFRTNGEGIVKSPPGMFDGELVDNDLKAVDSSIRGYYGMAPLVDAPKGKKAGE